MLVSVTPEEEEEEEEEEGDEEYTIEIYQQDETDQDWSLILREVYSATSAWHQLGTEFYLSSEDVQESADARVAQILRTWPALPIPTPIMGWESEAIPYIEVVQVFADGTEWQIWAGESEAAATRVFKTLVCPDKHPIRTRPFVMEDP